MQLIPPQILLGAYSEGVFPMAEGGELQWYSPVMRGVIPVDEKFHIPRGLKKALKKRPYVIRRDTAFREVMEGCADRDETWIDESIIESYVELHKLGFAHSIECWDEDGLQGGLYGVRYRGAFFGESMFSRKTDASKIALVYLVTWLRELGVGLLDTQWMTEHLSQFGGVEVPRDEYLQMLTAAMTEPARKV
ncbi:leucyl/phenylalanyl-tRNA--protein transferase [Rubritalea spongiae]|uniref:Leucyl/phenylalanyl-tRNA--protein transferase n=1 Tax=Rubritalea spongiae TaxID=430797 RepID=A0ABW5E5B6_9BACT